MANPAGVNRVALECQPGTRPHAAASLLLTMFLTVCLRCAQRPLRATVRRVPRSPRRQRTPSSPTITTATKNSDAAAARRAHGAQRSSTPDRVSLIIQTTPQPSCGAGGAPERLWEAAWPWPGPMWATWSRERRHSWQLCLRKPCARHAARWYSSYSTVM